MLHLGETVETTDPAVFLRGQNGTFRVWGPSGQVDVYECSPKASILSIRHAESSTPREDYLIEKIANSVTSRETGRNARHNEKNQD